MQAALPTTTTTGWGSDPQQVLEEVFGYQAFRPGQREIIDAVLAGRDCIGLMPTGAGKSLTFQIPAKLLHGAVLVISPLISLMKDQVDALDRTGFKAAVLNSTVGEQERRQTLRELRAGALELLYVAPEALGSSLRSIIAGCPISLVVVDEAHCISSWGHDFRPAYRQLRDLKAQLGDIPVLALTATATRRVALDIVRQLGMRKPAGYKGSFFRSNLRIIAQKKGNGRNTRADILSVVRGHRGETGIVYAATRRDVESLTDWLTSHHVNAVPYHAGLDDRTRTKNQEDFANDRVDVVVATIAFGMGIDKSNVRFVIHRDMARSIEAWYQEIGRAGRDGLPSDCITFFSWADVINYERFLRDIVDLDLRAETHQRTVGLFRLLERSGCRHQALCGYFDEQIEPCGDACDVCLGLSLDHVAPKVRASASTPRLPSTPIAVSQAEAERFEALRALRRQLSDAEKVPPYVVFSDAVLRELARRQPKTPQDMLAIPGIGPAKLHRYGEAFLAVLQIVQSRPLPRHEPPS